MVGDGLASNAPHIAVKKPMDLTSSVGSPVGPTNRYQSRPAFLNRVLEVADPFGILRIHADHGLTMTNAHGFDTLDEALLLSTLRMRFSDQSLNVRLERVTKWPQKSSNGGPGSPAKPVGKRTQTATSIDSMPFGITTGSLLNASS